MSAASKKKWSGIAKIAAVVLVVGLGIWGCARKPSERGESDRVRSLEGRCVKLEQDYRTAAQARDKARSDVAALEREAIDRDLLIKERDEARSQAEEAKAEFDRIARQLAQRTNERDLLRRDLNVTTAERDTVMGRYDRLRRGLQEVMAQDDDSQGASAVPAPVTLPIINGKS